MSHFYDWLIGPIKWPVVLVGWRRRFPQAMGLGNVVTVAAMVTISRQLLEGYGFDKHSADYVRWPSIDEIIFRDLERSL